VESSCEFGNEPSGSMRWWLVASRVVLSFIELVIPYLDTKWSGHLHVPAALTAKIVHGTHWIGGGLIPDVVWVLRRKEKPLASIGSRNLFTGLPAGGRPVY
jgi:hypothetical protein